MKEFVLQCPACLGYNYFCVDEDLPLWMRCQQPYCDALFTPLEAERVGEDEGGE